MINSRAIYPCTGSWKKPPDKISCQDFVCHKKATINCAALWICVDPYFLCSAALFFNTVLKKTKLLVREFDRCAVLAIRKSYCKKTYSSNYLIFNVLSCYSNRIAYHDWLSFRLSCIKLGRGYTTVGKRLHPGFIHSTMPNGNLRRLARLPHN
jgi:hypothetical protein